MITKTCIICGKQFQTTPSRDRKCCSFACGRKAASVLRVPRVTLVCDLEFVELACYLKEARAILEGRDVAGRNRCMQLAGD